MGSMIVALWRRKLLTFLAVLIALGAGYGVSLQGGPTYSYTATVLLLPPASARAVAPDKVDHTEGNPLFFLSTLGQARDVLIGSMTSKDVATALTEKYPGAAYSVNGDILSSAPVVVLSTTGPNQATAKALLSELTKELPVALARVQHGVGVNQAAQITSYQLTSDAKPEVSHKAQIRSAILTVGVAAVILMFLIGALDGLLRSRGRRRRGTKRDRVRQLPSDSEEAVGLAPVRSTPSFAEESASSDTADDDEKSSTRAASWRTKPRAVSR